MKKSDIIWCVAMLLCGIIILIVGGLKEFANPSTIFGIGFGLTFGGASALVRPFYWWRSKGEDQYEERLRQARVNRNDERKIMLREKSGQISYIIMTYVLLAVTIVFSFAGATQWVVITLWCVILFQYICGAVVYRWLDKKY